MAIQDANGWAMESPSFLMSSLTTLGFLVCLGFFSVSLAAGLYYVAEMAEENTVMARRILKTWLIAVIVVNALLLVVDGLHQCFVSMVANVVYASLLRNYPFADLSSPAVLASAVIFVIDTISWYLYFVDSTTPSYSITQVIGFFGTLVWVVPFGFFVTLSLSEDALPGLGTINAEGAHIKKRRYQPLLS
ncbi:Protein SVP26 [Diplonema papillatum]|nr:Protein SVP26 [Diplonema papillatum]